MHQPNGDVLYYFDGRLHREDGPAIEYADGTKMWAQKGNIHRKDGPALIYANNQEIDWYLDGVSYEFDDWCNILGLSASDRLFLRLKYM